MAGFFKTKQSENRKTFLIPVLIIHQVFTILHEKIVLKNGKTIKENDSAIIK